MAMQSVQATKHKIVTEILSNPTWMESSGLWCQLYNTLMKMSRNDLGCLKLVIEAKEQFAAENPGKWVG